MDLSYPFYPFVKEPRHSCESAPSLDKTYPNVKMCAQSFHSLLFCKICLHHTIDCFCNPSRHRSLPTFYYKRSRF
ncbi:hypothetical protein [Rickettsiella massiliensis]|uniref:hypothetical protein n=1 Tax=Rickettsiella massiliensis TaxID=676517 RepID=UPI0012EA9561